MKRIVVLTVVAFAATLTIGATASAQEIAAKPLFLEIACRGDDSVCTDLELYQKMAVTGTSASGDAAAKAATAARQNMPNQVAERKARTVGGVDNNPAEDGPGIRAAFVKNADRQTRLRAKTDRREVAASSANRPARVSQGERVRNRMLRRGGDPTDNNPFSESGATARGRVQPQERPAATVRDRLVRSNERALYMIRQREITRHRPTDF